jgi:bacterial/archaeal transporter family protein
MVSCGIDSNSARFVILASGDECIVKSLAASWQFWALLSACFAALTAIFAKVGVENVNSDFATFIRTIVILLVLAGILVATGQWQSPTSVSSRTYLFLLFSGLATGASWLCYFRALKLSGLNWLGIAMIAGGVILLTLRL